MIEELENYSVTQTIEGDKIVIRPKHFLGADTFAKVAEIVRNNGGEYVSAGKASHFVVPIKKPAEPTRMSGGNVVNDVIMGLNSYAMELEKIAKTFRQMAKDLEDSS